MRQGEPWPPNSALSLLSSRDRDVLLRLGRRTDHAPGDVLLNHGEHSTHVFVILHGYVKITTTSYSGREVLLAVRSGGDLVGELAGMDGSPRMATAQTAGPATTRLVTAAEFHAFLDAHPAAFRSISASISAKLRSATDKIVDYGSHDVQARLARVILRLVRDHGVSTPEGVAVALHISQPELASITSASEAAVSKALTDLRFRRVILTGYRTFTVLDRDALLKLAELPPDF
ncbi:Crp/Fnr family transcriptional regulator [Nocardiopsis sp. HUAS JQ3]|uniref:Crp/Fnr family transcriptional regulator n=1 Tax=Nocardiopsis sp. HUAS JQ3 TaxID=3061629 RepID=UPI0023A9B49E|nr:Crp/Fnr family transcriptional regulator [Nocardiopsis sp. HUAS JQ3]WDZ90672.1 Crp/Fnr family transcriptional regulator [Nocardiopsis sp. HUAS JQ3]